MHDRMQDGANVSGFETETAMPETADDMLRDGQGTRAMFSDTGRRFGEAMDRAGQQISGDAGASDMTAKATNTAGSDTDSTAYSKPLAGMNLREDESAASAMPGLPGEADTGRRWSFAGLGPRARRWSGWGNVDPEDEAALIG